MSRTYTSESDAFERIANFSQQELFNLLDIGTQDRLQAAFVADLDDDDRLTAVLGCIGKSKYREGFRESITRQWETFLERKDLRNKHLMEIANNLGE